MQSNPSQSISSSDAAATVRTGLPSDGSSTFQSGTNSFRSSCSSPKQVQSLADSRYTFVGELGRGGCGIVDRVKDRALDREVALKRLPSDQSAFAEDIAAFLREAKVTSQLQHPGIVPVHDLSIRDDGTIVYVMKVLEGETLGDQIRARHAPPNSSVSRRALYQIIAPLLARFIDVCNAVGYAHEKGVIHCDLKPDNVMTGAFGETVVLDWGLAFLSEPIKNPESKIYGNGDSVSDGGPPLSGTPAYMSPEQARGQQSEIGAPSDIYALGMILFEIVVGNHPYVGLDTDETIDQCRKGVRHSIVQHQPSVDRALAAIVETAMATDPADRYQSAQLLAEDVRRYVAGEPVSVYQDSFPDRIVRWCRHHRIFATATAAATTVLLIASILFGIVVHRAHQAERTARIESQTSHALAIADLRETRALIDRWMQSLNTVAGASVDRDSIANRLYEDAIVYLSDIVGQPIPNDIETKREWEQYHLRLAELYRRVGEAKQATQHRQHAEQIRRQLADVDQ